MPHIPLNHHQRHFGALSRSCDPEPLKGIIVGLSEHLVMLSVINHDYLADGFAVLRRKDITAWQDLEEDFCYQTAKQYFDLQLPAVPPLDLRSIYALLEHWPADESLTCYIENRDPDVCYIGTVREIRKTQGWLDMLTIDTDCRTDNVERIGLEEISRVDFGGRYSRIVFAGNQSRQRK